MSSFILKVFEDNESVIKGKPCYVRAVVLNDAYSFDYTLIVRSMRLLYGENVLIQITIS